MKDQCLRILATAALVYLSSALQATALPLYFNEISLLVRAKESESSIAREVGERKLVRALTPQQESLLKTQGATESLVRSLRNPNVMLPPAQAAAFESAREQNAKASAPGTNRSAMVPRETAPSERLHVFDVSYGHPVNLSRWGGPAYEFAFQVRRFAGEDLVEPILVDTSRSFTDAATYLGAGRPDDGTTIFDRRNYVSVISYSASRPLSIDLQNPVSVKGVPYLLYPVYGGGGVSLYYIGKSAGSVKLAVSTPGR